MALLLTESDVRSLLTMPIAMAAVEDCFRRLAQGAAQTQPRRRLHFAEKSFMHYMAASDAGAGYLGLKIYTTLPSGARFLIPLYTAKTGELTALIEGDYLGQMRTAAATGVASRYMARADAHTVGIIGTGLQARTQLEAIVHARKIDTIRAFGRDKERREKFAAEMSERTSVTVTAAGSAESAVRDADIVITMTSSVKPVLDGRWLAPGMHVNATGSNFPQKAELDQKAVLWADIIAVDSLEQAKMEAGDLIQAFDGDAARWESVRELSQIVDGKIAGRNDDKEITLFKSIGIAEEDIATASRVYELAKEKGVGRDVPMWQAGD
jgi:ornithine cyclodeaminase/alanine dehydrogenase-like protein (mu-crystallin family)